MPVCTGKFPARHCRGGGMPRPQEFHTPNRRGVSLCRGSCHGPLPMTEGVYGQTIQKRSGFLRVAFPWGKVATLSGGRMRGGRNYDVAQSLGPLLEGAVCPMGRLGECPKIGVGCRGFREKPSPWGEGVTPKGVTDVGPCLFLSSSKIVDGPLHTRHGLRRATLSSRRGLFSEQPASGEAL